eukprot:5251759-Pyramimonas_sp.AAC.1
MKRSAPVQFCPMLWKVPRMANGMSWLRSASSHTMKGSLPPSSSTTGVRFDAAASITCVTLSSHYRYVAVAEGPAGVTLSSHYRHVAVAEGPAGVTL